MGGCSLDVVGGLARGEEPVDLLAGEQVWAGRDERGLPPVAQHVGVRVPVGAQPAAEVADVGHPGPVPAGTPPQLLEHLSFDAAAVSPATVRRLGNSGSTGPPPPSRPPRPSRGE